MDPHLSFGSRPPSRRVPLLTPPSPAAPLLSGGENDKNDKTHGGAALAVLTLRLRLHTLHTLHSYTHAMLLHIPSVVRC